MAEIAAAPLLRDEGGTGEMIRNLLGLGLGLAMSTLGVAAVSTTAYADSTCYTGCSAPGVGGAENPPAQQVSHSVSTPTQAPSSGGLAFTGADIESMGAVGVGAVVVGGVMVRRSRRHRQTMA